MLFLTGLLMRELIKGQTVALYSNTIRGGNMGNTTTTCRYCLLILGTLSAALRVMVIGCRHKYLEVMRPFSQHKERRRQIAVAFPPMRALPARQIDYAAGFVARQE